MSFVLLIGLRLLLDYMFYVAGGKFAELIVVLYSLNSPRWQKSLQNSIQDLEQLDQNITFRDVDTRKVAVQIEFEQIFEELIFILA